MLKVVMARGRRLKKGDGDLEAHKQKCCFIITDNWEAKC
jgi:hypothetical protein